MKRYHEAKAINKRIRRKKDWDRVTNTPDSIEKGYYWSKTFGECNNHHPLQCNNKNCWCKRSYDKHPKEIRDTIDFKEQREEL